MSSLDFPKEVVGYLVCQWSICSFYDQYVFVWKKDVRKEAEKRKAGMLISLMGTVLIALSQVLRLQFLANCYKEDSFLAESITSWNKQWLSQFSLALMCESTQRAFVHVWTYWFCQCWFILNKKRSSKQKKKERGLAKTLKNKAQWLLSLYIACMTEFSGRINGTNFEK